jgi:hypothetical protein
MEQKNALICRLAIEVVAAQLAAGAKHPSPGLITEAVDTASAVVDEIEACVERREKAAADAAQAKADAEAKAALDAKVAAEAAAAAAKAAAELAAKTGPTAAP